MKHLVLTICGCLFGLYGFSQPSQQAQVGPYTYDFYDDNNTCILTDIVEDVSGELTLPSSVVFNEKNYAVTSIGSPSHSYFGESPSNHVANVTKLIIPEGVQKITCSFSAFHHAHSIIIPSTVTSLTYTRFSPNLSEGYHADWFDYSTLPTTLAYMTFYDLENIEILSDHLSFKSIDGVLYSKDGKTLILCPRGRKGEFVIPDGVERLENKSFYGCNQLEKITLPASLKELGDNPVDIIAETGEWMWNYKEAYVFAFCFSIHKIQLPDVEYISAHTFYHCWSLEHFVIPATTKWIASNAFEGDWGLETIDWNNCQLEEIGNKAFSFKNGNKPPLYTLSLPFHVKSIGALAFENCLAPEILVLSADLEHLGESFVSFYHENSSANASERLAPVKAIYNYRIEPLDVGESVFGLDEVRRGRITEKQFPQTWADNCVLYVPIGSADAYKAHGIWGRFKNIQEFDTTTGIKKMEKPSNVNTHVYDLMGRTVIGKPQKGLYLINGKKVVVTNSVH